MMPIENTYATSYKSLIVTLDISHTIFEMMTQISLFSPSHPFWCPCSGDLSELPDETNPKNYRDKGYCI